MCNFLGTCSTVGSVSDCRSRGGEFDPGLVSYFCGDLSSIAFLLPSADLKTVVDIYKRKMCTKYWLTA